MWRASVFVPHSLPSEHGTAQLLLAFALQKLALGYGSSNRPRARIVRVRRNRDDEKCHPPAGRGSAFQHCCERIELSIQRSHLGTFLFGWHLDIGDIYIHSSGLIPSV
jgi:hypothetical protein